MNDDPITQAAVTRVDKIEAFLPGVARRLIEIREEGSRKLDIRTKAGFRDLVTRADLESEKLIVEHIEGLFPDDRILAEEGGKAGGSGKFLWVIDPVDGTVNYAHGIPLYAVSIGLIYEETPIAGIVIIPAMNEIFRAELGRGARLNGSSIRVSGMENLKDCVVVTGFPYERDGILDSLTDTVKNVLANSAGFRRSGSAALDLCWFSAGRFDAFYEAGLKPWDTCAGTLIASEAGARVTDFEGKTYHPLYSKTLVATNGNYHDDLLIQVEPLAKVQRG